MIPQSFTIFGQEYLVKFVDSVDSKDSCGECVPMENEIRIKKNMPLSLQEQTFYHELCHCLLTNLSYGKLNDDEDLVDRLAQGLHQVMKTSKY